MLYTFIKIPDTFCLECPFDQIPFINYWGSEDRIKTHTRNLFRAEEMGYLEHFRNVWYAFVDGSVVVVKTNHRCLLFRNCFYYFF